MAQNNELETRLSRKGYKCKITNSYNPKEAYRAISKNKFAETGGIKVNERQYLDIIKAVDLLIEKEFLKGKTIKLPHRMGSIELRKKETAVYYDKNGKIRTNRTIDWAKTRKLWSEDKECLESKILVYKDNKIKPCVYYNKIRSIFPHKRACKFQVNRKIIQKAHIVLEEGDCFIFNKG